MRKFIFLLLLTIIVSSYVSATMIVTNFADDTVSLIDDNKELIILDVGDGPSKIGISENYAVISNTIENSISIIDLTKKEVIATIPVGKNPLGIDIYKNEAYIVNSGSSSVSVIDIQNLKLLKTIKVGNAPVDIAIDKKGEKAYVSNIGSASISVIDTKIGSVTNEIKSLRHIKSPVAISITPNSKFLYVLDSKDNKLVHINLASETFEESSLKLADLSLNSELVLGNKYGVVSSNYRPAKTTDEDGTGKILIIDLEKQQVINSIDIDDTIYGLDFQEGIVYATKNENKIFSINLKTNNVQEIIVGDSPRSVRVFEAAKTAESSMQNFRRIMTWIIIILLLLILVLRARRKRKEMEFDRGFGEDFKKEKIIPEKKESADKTRKIQKKEKAAGISPVSEKPAKKKSKPAAHAAIKKTKENKDEKSKESKKSAAFEDITDEFISRRGKRKDPSEKSILDLNPEEVEEEMLSVEDDLDNVQEVDIEYDFEVDEDKY